MNMNSIGGNIGRNSDVNQYNTIQNGGNRMNGGADRTYDRSYTSETTSNGTKQTFRDMDVDRKSKYDTTTKPSIENDLRSNSTSGVSGKSSAGDRLENDIRTKVDEQFIQMLLKLIMAMMNGAGSKATDSSGKGGDTMGGTGVGKGGTPGTEGQTPVQMGNDDLSSGKTGQTSEGSNASSGSKDKLTSDIQQMIMDAFAEALGGKNSKGTSAASGNTTDKATNAKPSSSIASDINSIVEDEIKKLMKLLGPILQQLFAGMAAGNNATGENSANSVSPQAVE